MYVANVKSSDVSIFNTKNYKKIKTIKVGKSPYAIVFDKDGGKAFVTNQHENTISVIDTINNKNIKKKNTNLQNTIQ